MRVFYNFISFQFSFFFSYILDTLLHLRFLIDLQHFFFFKFKKGLQQAITFRNHWRGMNIILWEIWQLKWRKYFEKTDKIFCLSKTFKNLIQIIILVISNVIIIMSWKFFIQNIHRLYILLVYISSNKSLPCHTFSYFFHFKFCATI